MNSDYTIVSRISDEQVHQVAMVAADTVSKSAMQSGFSPDNIGTLIAKAYLQAYEAVEGWTKQETQTQTQSVEPFSGHMVMFRYGDSISVQCTKTKKTVTVTVYDRGTVDFMLPKDA